MAVDQSTTDEGATGPLGGLAGTGLAVAQDGDGPAHRRLADQLRARITQGVLRPGDRMPSSRALAEDLRVSRWVVTEVYDQLKAEGYLTARSGSGTVVASGVRPTAGDTLAVHTPPVPAQSVDLSPALPDLASFPRTAWRAAVGKALATATDRELGHPDPQGSPVLRSTMADYLRRVRGIVADADQVHVTQGVRSAVALVCRVLREGGATVVAVEDPCWPRLRETASRSGLRVVPIPVDDDGLRVDLLDDAAQAVFLTPTHQFPLGVPLAAHRRVALAQWAARTGGLIVEDDYDAEFRYDRRPLGALAALAREHVVYLGSASKTVSPGLHLGWMVAPSSLGPRLAAARADGATLSPTVDQLALAHLVTSGAYDRHLRRMRREYQRRRIAMLAALRVVPGAPGTSMDAGLHVLWLLPDGTDELQVLGRAQDLGVQVVGLSQCRVQPGPAGLVIGYGTVAEHQAPQVAELLRSAVDPG